MAEIEMPYNYDPRDYQLPFWAAYDSGLYTRFYKVWHRRAGKDLTDLALCNREAIEKTMVVTYVFPTLKMGREILWEGMDNEGNPILEKYFPIGKKGVISRKTNDTRMTIYYDNGSIFRVAGTDNPDSLRGGNTGLFVFSEWAEHDPYAWTVVRPIVRANKGRAIFNMTPKGDNHAKTMFEAAEKRMKDGKNWWCQKLTALDTPVFTKEELAEELEELISEHGEIEGRAKYDQEYMCSFDAPVVGSYFGEAMKAAEADNRVTSVPYDANVPVNTAWDLGVGDSNVLWFYQIVGKEVHIIDMYVSSGVGIEHYANVMRGTVPGYERMAKYSYNVHIAPHDIEVTELGTGKSRRETALQYGINFIVAPKFGLDDGIEATRRFISRCWFDKEKCENGISALKNYHKEWDEKNKVYQPRPKHDWSSHYADAFRYLAIGHVDMAPNERLYERIETDQDLGLMPKYRRRGGKGGHSFSDYLKS